MLAIGNGRPEVCALNLLRITRGEVPYERIKGRDGILTDAPATSATADAVSDARWLLKTYEPRVEAEDIDIDWTLSDIGELGLSASLKRREDAG